MRGRHSLGYRFELQECGDSANSGHFDDFGNADDSSSSGESGDFIIFFRISQTFCFNKNKYKIQKC